MGKWVVSSIGGSTRKNTWIKGNLGDDRAKKAGEKGWVLTISPREGWF